MLPQILTTEMIATTAAVVVPVTSLAVAYMRLSMSNAIRGLKLDLIKELDGTYVRYGEHSDLKERVQRLEGVAD